MTAKFVYVSETKETGSAIIEVNELTGENRIIVMIGANTELLPSEVDGAEEEFIGCDIVLIQLENEP